MLRGIFAVFIGVMSAVSSALADEAEKYTFKENVKVGQVVEMESTGTGKLVNADNTQVRDHQYVKAKLTVTQVKDGSATQIKVETSPDSYNTRKLAYIKEEKFANALAGKTVVVTRADDGTATIDQKVEETETSEMDINYAEGMLAPDADLFPDHPVAVGDAWDAGPDFAVHSELDTKAKGAAKLKLDWVKTINGRQVAQISESAAIVTENEDGDETDSEISGVLRVDVAQSQIVGADVKIKQHFLSKDGAKLSNYESQFSCSCGSELADKQQVRPQTQPVKH